MLMAFWAANMSQMNTTDEYSDYFYEFSFRMPAIINENALG